MTLLTAAEILSAEDIVIKDLEVPEWGGTVRLRGLSGKEAGEFMEEFNADKGSGTVKLAALSMIGEDGERLFTKEQVEELKLKSLAAFMRIQRVALKMNGMTDEDGKVRKND